ncbi:hypothetical protein RHCRD62_90217 [Rhodococcus sp. RD6.2]|nr:hypothetical protein RHCRD62_90217 [Rhodococcus sp. RD6.2]
MQYGPRPPRNPTDGPAWLRSSSAPPAVQASPSLTLLEVRAPAYHGEAHHIPDLVLSESHWVTI